jgi:hypothetical protein
MSLRTPVEDDDTAYEKDVKMNVVEGKDKATTPGNEATSLALMLIIIGYISAITGPDAGK